MIPSLIHRPALFLDRDGVLNKRKNPGYILNTDEFVLLEGVAEAIKLLNKIFYPVVVVTNQQGIGKGLMTHRDLFQIHHYMTMEIEKIGGEIHEIYYCPHHASDRCQCRKPATGMFMQALVDFPWIRFNHALMVGDSATDIIPAKSLGIRSCYLGPMKDVEANFYHNDLISLAHHLWATMPSLEPETSDHHIHRNGKRPEPLFK